MFSLSILRFFIVIWRWFSMFSMFSTIVQTQLYECSERVAVYQTLWFIIHHHTNYIRTTAEHRPPRTVRGYGL